MKPVLHLQTLGLLPVEMDAAAVARFLRCCPGLNKQTIGELLGEHDEFFLEVLRHFTDTFEFSGDPSVLLSLSVQCLPLPCGVNSGCNPAVGASLSLESFPFIQLHCTSSHPGSAICRSCHLQVLPSVSSAILSWLVRRQGVEGELLKPYPYAHSAPVVHWVERRGRRENPQAETCQAECAHCHCVQLCKRFCSILCVRVTLHPRPPPALVPPISQSNGRAWSAWHSPGVQKMGLHQIVL